jgi:hypothetical protein
MEMVNATNVMVAADDDGCTGTCSGQPLSQPAHNYQHNNTHASAVVDEHEGGDDCDSLISSIRRNENDNKIDIDNIVSDVETNHLWWCDLLAALSVVLTMGWCVYWIHFSMDLTGRMFPATPVLVWAVVETFSFHMACNVASAAFGTDNDVVVSHKMNQRATSTTVAAATYSSLLQKGDGDDDDDDTDDTDDDCDDQNVQTYDGDIQSIAFHSRSTRTKQLCFVVLYWIPSSCLMWVVTFGILPHVVYPALLEAFWQDPGGSSHEIMVVVKWQCMEQSFRWYGLGIGYLLGVLRLVFLTLMVLRQMVIVQQRCNCNKNVTDRGIIATPTTSAATTRCKDKEEYTCILSLSSSIMRASSSSNVHCTSSTYTKAADIL